MSTNQPEEKIVSAMKYVRLVRCTPEEVGGWEVTPLSDAELADIRAENAAARKKREELHTRLLAATNDPGAIAILNLHAPCDDDLSSCAGCPTDDMGCPEYWPCDTIEVAASAYGVADQESGHDPRQAGRNGHDRGSQ